MGMISSTPKSNDRPAKIEGGAVVGRLHDQVPGPIVQSLPQRNWFPM